jgi:hypothetical protein
MIYVYNLLEEEYDSIYEVEDTPIEAIWTEIAEKDTGDPYSTWF